MSFDNTLTRLSSSESVSSPLRKKSILALSNTRDTPETFVNDDDAERRERRRKSFAPDPATVPVAQLDSANRRKSLGLGACSGLSTAQLSEHFANCIKLSTENKITVKNAFSLQLIDYMSMMLKRHDKQMEDFQVASCTLDASTKIYSFRVDAVHSDVVQMATSMGRAETNRKKRSNDDDGTAPDGDVEMDNGDEGPQESQVLKKLKKKSRKHKSCLADKPESLQRKQQVFQTMNPFLVRLSASLAVSQSGECPFHHALKHRVNSNDFEAQENGDGKESNPSRGWVDLPPLPDTKNLEICPSFRDFTFLGWRPENDPRPTSDIPPPPPAFPDLNDDHVFDMNQTPEPIPEMDCNGGGVFDDGMGMDSDHEELYAAPEAACRAAAKLTRQPAHVVDLKQHLSTVPLEYSYFQQSMLSLWAGPAHWKVKPVRKDKENDVAVQKEAKKRTKKEMVLNFGNTAELQKCFGNAMKKLNRKTIQGWNTDRVTMPKNIHYDPKRITRLFLRESVSVTVSDDTMPPEVDDGVAEYQYDNPTDQASFCPNVPADDDGDDDHGADIGDGITHDDDDMDPTQDVPTEMETQEHEIGAFTGDNLIAAPNKVARIYIPYQMRAKKMDMKKLKSAMWSVLTNTPEIEADDTDNQKRDDARMQDASTFRSLYETLPHRLAPKVAENLSPALAFVGLLHLANEKCLSITGLDDLSNLNICQP